MLRQARAPTCNVFGPTSTKGGSMAEDHGPSIKDDEQYEGLRKKGMSKQRAAKIANSPGAEKRGGKKAGRKRKSSKKSSGSKKSSRKSGGSKKSSGGRKSSKKASAGRKGGRKTARKK